MVRWQIIFLALSSLLLSSCAYHKFAKLPKQSEKVIGTNDLIPLVPSNGKSVKYKATIDILKNHFTGLIVIKQTDSLTKHLVFVTELGMRMFDFEVKNDSMKPVFVFAPLNKPKLIQALLRNFNSMLLLEWFNTKATVIGTGGPERLYIKKAKRNLFVTTNEKHFATELNVFNKRKKESKTVYTNEYSSVHLKQYGLVKLYIELEKVAE